MNFKNWTDAKEKAEELNLYTKAFLKEKYNRKPLKEAKFELHKVYTGGKWRTFEFYKMEDTQEIKNRVKKELVQLEITNDNIFKSLYVINKSAKKSRDTKVRNYDLSNYGIVRSSKTRQNNLYNLKDNVIQKAIKENKLILKGFHIQEIENRTNYLNLYISQDNYTFHVPTDEKPNVEYLGDITGIITAEVKIKTNISYNQAIDLLNRYLNM